MGIYAEAVADGIWKSGAKRVGYIPSVTVAPVVEALVTADGGTNGVSPHVTPLSREEEAVAVMGAMSLAGDLGAVVMQDNGFGNALTALTTFSISYHLPLLIFANTRGGLGEYNSMIHSISQPTPTLLRSVGLYVEELDRRSSPDDWRDVVEEAGVHARMTYRPVVVLGSFWNTDGKGRLMRRIDALTVIGELTDAHPVVVTCAATSREFASVKDTDNHLYLLDSMGLVGSVATGLALALSETSVPKVIGLEGDGSLLMNPNVLPTGGYLQPTNLVIIVLDNGIYGSTGGLPTYATSLDLGAIAESCNWTVFRAADPERLRSEYANAIAVDGPTFLHVRIDPGNASDIAKLLIDPVTITHRFARWLEQSRTRVAEDNGR